jgi:hypothetical protein
MDNYYNYELNKQIYEDFKEDFSLCFIDQIAKNDKLVDVSKFKGRPFIGDKKWLSGDCPLCCFIVEYTTDMCFIDLKLLAVRHIPELQKNYDLIEDNFCSSNFLIPRFKRKFAILN